MSVLTDFSRLEYLHDAGFSSFIWDCSDRTMRRVILAVHADDDVEYEPWKGRVMTIILSDVVMCRLNGWGCQIGEERIDTWTHEVSTEFELECHRLRNAGIDIPPFSSTISLGSGSSIELVFGQMFVDVEVSSRT